jgi:hypothetical protein
VPFVSDHERSQSLGTKDENARRTGQCKPRGIISAKSADIEMYVKWVKCGNADAKMLEKHLRFDRIEPSGWKSAKKKGE